MRTVPSTMFVCLFLLLSTHALAQPCVQWTQIQEVSSPSPEGSAFWHGIASDPSRVRTLLVDASDTVSTRARVFEYEPVGPPYWYDVTPPGTPGPSTPRKDFGFCWDTANDRGVLFGGFANSLQTNELWFWPGNNSGWVQMPATGNWPPPAYRAEAVYDSVHNRVIVLLDVLSDSDTIQVWEYAAGVWTRGPDYADGSSRDYQAVFEEHNERVFVRTSIGFFESAATYRPAATPGAGVWSVLTINPPTQSRDDPTLAYDPTRNRVIKMAGNYSFVNFTSCAVAWDESTSGWQSVAPQDGDGNCLLPVGINDADRAGAVMTYDLGSDRMVLFGGYRRYFNEINEAIIVNFSDTWVLEQRVPGLAVEPVSTVVCLGQSVSLSALGVGGPPLNYQWYKNNVPLGGETNPTLNLGIASASTGADYRVVVSNDCGSTSSKTITVTVVDSVQIVAQPTDLVACPGPNVLQGPLAVPLTGAEVFTWERNTPQSGWQTVQEGPSPTLIFLDGTAQDNGFYRCRVANSCSSVTSVAVEVRFGAVFDVHPQSMAVGSLCGSAVLTASARTVDGSPPVYQWLLDGKPLVNGPHVSGAQTGTLTLSNLGAEDAGAFVCSVTDPSCGTVYSKPARLTPTTFAPDRWNQIAVGGLPTRVTAAMAYDANRGVVVLYGGKGDSDTLGDTWEWDGSTWTEVATPNTPLKREYAQLFYDQLRGKLILFGGNVTQFDPLQPQLLGWRSDMWTYDGADWTPFQPDGPPTYGTFSEVNIFHDDARDKYILARANPFNNFAETYLFDPNTEAWSLHSTLPGGGVAGIDLGANGDIAFDRSLGRAVQHIGWHTDQFGFTRVFDASASPNLSWSTSMTTAPRSIYPELAYDPVRQRIISFGNDTFSNFTTESYFLADDVWTPLYASGFPLSPPAGFPPDGFRALGLVFDTQRATMVLIGRHEFAPNKPLEVWEYSYTLCDSNEPCPADTNGDGMLSPADFTAWIAAFNAMSPACDQNGDGICTPGDFTAWIANYNAGC